MFSLIHIAQGSSVLRTLAENRNYTNWQETALSWLVATIVIAIAVAVVMLLVKLLLKMVAKNILSLTWSRQRTILFMLVGLLPLLFIAWLVWYRSRDFGNVIGYTGLFKGVLIGWVLYAVVMLGGHSAGPWQRDIF